VAISVKPFTLSTRMRCLGQEAVKRTPLRLNDPFILSSYSALSGLQNGQKSIQKLKNAPFRSHTARALALPPSRRDFSILADPAVEGAARYTFLGLYPPSIVKVCPVACRPLCLIDKGK
jgi:hypothetical protein